MTKQDQKDEQLFLKRMADLADRADRIGYPVFSDFLDAGKRSLLARSFKNVSVRLDFIGGYKDAERVIAAFYPSFLDAPEPEESPLRAVYLRLKGAKFLAKKPQHRDYLGALLGLGIKRETMGDILVDEEGAAVICLDTIQEYLLQNVSGVGRAEVEAEQIPLDRLSGFLSDGKILVISVSSERLDAVVGKTFALSRQEASHLIQSGRVQVNWREELRPDLKIVPEDLISVRGYGRIRMLETVGTSKSGRLQCKVEKFGGGR